MRTFTNILLCSFLGYMARGKVVLDADRPFLRVPLSHQATLECCYYTDDTFNLTWIHRFHDGNETKGPFHVRRVYSVRADPADNGRVCDTLTVKSVRLNDSGLYQCHLVRSYTKRYFSRITHGTYLQVYTPLEKTIKLSESTKNKILTAEGILLLLCVLVPGIILLRQSKSLNELERKKVKVREEENIYQGLNLDDCCTTYDQIERSHAQDPYQDVCNMVAPAEDIQLEKP